MLFFAAMEATTIAVAVLSHYLAPVFVAAAAPWVLRTPRRRGAVVLSLLALLGLSIVLEPWRLGDAASAGAGGRLGRPLLGAMLGAGSAVFYAANVFITKKLGPRFTAEEQLSVHAILSALLLLGVAIVVRAPVPTGGGALRVAIGGAVVGATAGLLFLRGLKRIAAEHASMLCFLEPLTAVLIAWAAWGERPSPGAVVGFVLVIGAGVIAVRGPATAPA